MTYENWTQLDLFENTEDRGLLQEDSLVNLGPLPESERDIRIQKTVISGQKCFASYQISNPNTSLERMCQDLLTFPWESNARALTWKRNTKSQHLIFQLVPSRLPTKENESGSLPSENLWATPNTLDHLPPRSEEATKKMQTGHRKGRTRPSNLREQVDPKTMSMYPTPTTKGFGHASEGQTLIFRRLVEEGKMTEEEAQQMMNGTTLRPPRMKEWMWPTPTATSAGKGEFLDSLVDKNGDKAKPGERAYNPKTGVHVQMTLDRATTMWPTPRAQDGKHGKPTDWEMTTEHSGTKNSLRVKVQKEEDLWPTPRVRGEEGLETLLKRKTLDQALMHNLKAATEYWPTPVSHEARLGYQDRTRGKKGSQESLTTKVINEDGGRQKNPKVQLNPEWVSTYLMGYPRHWLSSTLELQELDQTYQTEPRN